MKKFALMYLLVLLTSIQLFAQSKSDVFGSNSEITWLGIDYSDVRFIGPASGWGEVSTKTSGEMKDKYFPEWNNLIVREPKAFKIEEAVRRAEVKMDIDAVMKANEKMNKKEIFSESSSEYQHISESDIQTMVKRYDLKGKSGIGFVLIAEGMNKNLEEGSYWVTFIDMASKKVLFTKRVTGKAGGFGFRNYWAGSVKNVLKTMKKEFKSWD